MCEIMFNNSRPNKIALSMVRCRKAVYSALWVQLVLLADNLISTLLFMELVKSSVKLLLVVSKLIVIGYRLLDKSLNRKK